MSSFQLSSRLQALQEEGGVRGKEADGRLELTKLNLSLRILEKVASYWYVFDNLATDDAKARSKMARSRLFIFHRLI